MNVAESILAKGADAADALLHRGGAMTYAALREKVSRVACGLLDQGYNKGDRIGVFSENSPFFVSVYLGIMRAGLTAVPFQTEVGAGTFSEIVSDTGMRGVFVSNRFRNRVQAWAGELGLSLLPEHYGDHALGDGQAIFPEITASRDLAALMFTSGSTGSPKGVMVTHGNIECNTRDIISYMGLQNQDRAMVVLPFHYCFGLSLLHTHLMAGGSLVLNNEFKLFPEVVLMEMQRKECTGLAGVPSTYQILLRRSRFRELAFPRLRWFQQAGGKLPNACIEEILSSFPQARYFLMYGQTEGTARLSYLPPERLADKLGSIGTGLPSTRLEVLKADGTPVAPGSDEVGEIVAAGDNIALGYWNDPVETSRFFRGGRLHTGDLARVDEDGFIFIVERERDMIKAGGNRISAKEVEEVIAELPEVIEVAVLGAPHELLGEAVKAFVVPAPVSRITPQDVVAHCQRRLPGYKVPEEVFFLNTMIHNGSGKVLKQELRRLLEDRQPGEVEKAA
ncbi:MAG TPA: AMP-binding protein [Candidatus Paceibacterota bacterium]|nr:AMP-binding protein [Verrucomicrobiota bacterium]HSA08829.1 AMP-binding protein [Candidatus Paceibacterota bacterium]